MAVYQTVTNSFKQQCLQAVHNFGPTDPDVFKLALYTAAASIGPDTTVYTDSNEVTGTGYDPGGVELQISNYPTVANNSYNIPTAFVSFDNAQWLNASFTARGGLIYNSSKGNKSVAVLDFGADKTVVDGTFTVTMPVASANSAIIRIS